MINCVVNIMSCKSWTKKEIKLLKQHWFDNVPISGLCKFLPKRNRYTIRQKAIGLKLPSWRRIPNKPNPSLNQHFFKKWSKDMAYILGILAADGCIVKNKYETYTIIFALHKKDYNLIERVRDKIGKDLTIYKYYKKKSPECRLSFNSKIMGNDLISLGITPRKSTTLKFPSVPKKYLVDFIRGYIDGDGSISINKNGYVGLMIYGTKQFLKSFQDKIVSLINHSTYIGKDKRCNIFYLSINGQYALKLAGLFYQGANLKLDRKYQKYLEAKQLYGAKI